MKRIFALLAAALAALAVVVVARACTFAPPQLEPVAPVELDVDGEGAARRLAEAIRFRTISHQPGTPSDPAPFEGFIRWLVDTYPEVHLALLRERIADHTLLFTWPGSDRALAPILLTAHYDVVPVIPGTEDAWQHPPFAGDVVDGVVWGRGALDDKSALTTQLDAATHLLRAGFRPRRTIFFSFGHDEELGGRVGAAGVVEHLKAQGVRLAWSLDEGSFVIDGMLPGLELPVASVNVAEKGYLTLELVARGEGGHSSMPPARTAVGVLAEGIVRLQGAPLPGGVDGVTAELLDALGPHLHWTARLAFANRWLLGSLLDKALAGTATSNAMMRTTTAPTMLSGSIKENVLPIEAVATVNFRLHPRDRAEDVIAHVERVVAGLDIEVRAGTSSPPSPVSSTDSEGWHAIVRAIRETQGEVIVVPGLTIAGTDTKHYSQISDDSYRFNPMRVGPEDLTGFHGTNERVSIDNLARATRFYVQLIKHAAE